MSPPSRKAILLDVDDTLYDEKSYVISGFGAVAQHLAQLRPALDRNSLLRSMVRELEANGRGHVFDQALAEAGIEADPTLVRGLVDVYRRHTPAIHLDPGAAEALDSLVAHHDLAFITDGLGLMQRCKVAALGLDRWSDTVVYCWELEAPKPSPRGYLEALRILGHTPASAVIVGDNPAHDMAAARTLGAASIRVLTGRFASTPDDPAARPSRTISHLSELALAIAGLTDVVAD